MKVYIVYRVGIHIQGLVGVFSTASRALNAIKKAIAKERDKYHDFCLLETTLNKHIDADESALAHTLREPTLEGFQRFTR